MKDGERLREAAVALRLRGLSASQIARELGIRKSSTLSDRLKGTPPPDWTRRPRAKDAERDRAREMRLEGTSYAEIAAALGVSKSSISLWVRDLPRPPSEPAAAAARRAGAERYFAQRRRTTFVERQNEKLRWANELGELSDRELLIAGAVAYWAEGTKSKPWRRSEAVRFVNSDPGMIRLFLWWLQAAGVEPERLRYQVHIHETADIEAAERFWADVVGVPVGRLQRSTLKRHKPLTSRRNVADTYHGCLCIRVVDAAKLYRRIEGTWWAVNGAQNATVVATGDDSIDGPASVLALPSVRLARFRRILASARRR
jgi:transcriptional regulator with XRE-family HTH domain